MSPPGFAVMDLPSRLRALQDDRKRGPVGGRRSTRPPPRTSLPAPVCLAGLLRLVGVDDGLAAGAGALQPLLGHGLAAFLELGLQIVPRHFHHPAVAVEPPFFPVGPPPPPPPAVPPGRHGRPT